MGNPSFKLRNIATSRDLTVASGPFYLSVKWLMRFYVIALPKRFSSYSRTILQIPTEEVLTLFHPLLWIHRAVVLRRRHA